MKDLQQLLNQKEPFTIAEAISAAESHNAQEVIYDEMGNTILHRLISFRRGVGKGPTIPKALEYLVKVFDYDINVLNKNNETPLQYLMNGCNSNTTPENNNGSEFTLYSFVQGDAGRLPSCELNNNLIAGYFFTSDALFLIRLGAKPLPDKYYQPLLHRLVTYYKSTIPKQNLDTIIELVEKHNIDINSLDQQNRTPLQVLLELKNFSLTSLSFLLDLGANPNLLSGNSKVAGLYREPLLTRIIQMIYQSNENLEENKKLVEQYISKYKINIYLENEEGHTAIRIICQKKLLEPAQIFSLLPLFIKDFFKKNKFDDVTTLFLDYKSTLKNPLKINSFFQQLRLQAYDQLRILVNEMPFNIHKLALLKSAKKHCTLFSMHGLVGQLFREQDDSNIITKIDDLISKIERQCYSPFFIQSEKFDKAYEENYSLDNEAKEPSALIKKT